MCIQNQHHFDMRKQFKSICTAIEFFDSEISPWYWKEIPHRKASYHYELYLNSSFPIKVKLVHAEDSGNNQAKNSYGQVAELVQKGDLVLFIYRGRGWKSRSHKEALSLLRNLLGKTNVIHIRELEQWLENQLSEKESR